MKLKGFSVDIVWRVEMEYWGFERGGFFLDWLKIVKIIFEGDIFCSYRRIKESGRLW